MRKFKRYCREHQITQKRAFLLGLILFGDDLLLVLLVVVLHYLHLGSI